MTNKPNSASKASNSATTPPAPSQQTLQQRRAAAAWTDSQAVPAPNRESYKSLVRGFAAMIQTDGLGAALAFLKAKNKQEHQMLTQHLSGWVLKQLGASNQTDLLNWLLGQNSGMYRRAASEAIAYLMWLKRFAEAWG